ARRAARGRYHAVPGNHGAGRDERPQARAAFRDGNPSAPGSGLSHRALARTLRVAGPDVQRTDALAGWTHACVRPPWPGLQPERAGNGLARRLRDVRRAAVTARPAAGLQSDAPDGADVLAAAQRLEGVAHRT